MNKSLVCVVAAGALLGGCNHLTVKEGVLSTNQRVAMVSDPGDGVTPPTTVVLYEATPGEFVPVSTGFAHAPVTAALAGLGAGVAIGVGDYAAAKARRPSTINGGDTSIGEQNNIDQSQTSSQSCGGDCDSVQVQSVETGTSPAF